MLTLYILGTEYFDEKKNEFVYPESIELHLEHSLVSLSKWEAEFEKPFLTNKQHTDEEALSYIYHMIVAPEVPRDIVNLFTEKNIRDVDAYINRKQTATWFSETGPVRRNGEIITNELIYFWMSEFGIALECQEWPLQRLFTLIQVHSKKREDPKKKDPKTAAAQRKALNDARRAQYNSKG